MCTNTHISPQICVYPPSAFSQDIHSVHVSLRLLLARLWVFCVVLCQLRKPWVAQQNRRSWHRTMDWTSGNTVINPTGCSLMLPTHSMSWWTSRGCLFWKLRLSCTGMSMCLCMSKNNQVSNWIFWLSQKTQTNINCRLFPLTACHTKIDPVFKSLQTIVFTLSSIPTKTFSHRKPLKPFTQMWHIENKIYKQTYSTWAQSDPLQCIFSLKMCS